MTPFCLDLVAASASVFAVSSDPFRLDSRLGDLGLWDWWCVCQNCIARLTKHVKLGRCLFLFFNSFLCNFGSRVRVTTCGVKKFREPAVSPFLHFLLFVS